MFQFIKKMFIAVLISLVNSSSHTKCVSLSNQKCEIQPTLLKLHLHEYSQELHYYSFAIMNLEVVILLMTFLIKCVFQIKQKI